MGCSSGNQLWWCKSCGVPLLRGKCEICGGKGIRICSDLKPMFEEECEFLENEIGKKLPGKGWREGLWMRHKTIWFNGKRLMRLSANGKPTIVKEYPLDNGLTSPDYPLTPEIPYKANKSTLDELEEEALSFIKEITQIYPERKTLVSFSGGKDSAVVSYLVRKALGTNEIPHIFGNTTMEYPDTLNYIRRFSNGNGRIPFYENSSSYPFIEMCRLIGPPSRINAWCCSVFKASPIASIVNRINGSQGVISFEGIRRRESVRRRNRQKTYLNKKIVHQLSAYPILDWKEIEVWLFILVKGIDFNDAYEKGFSRVGCMYCPNNIAYNEYLIRSYYSEENQGWMDFLLDYAREIGKEYPYDWITSGAWKMRVGKSRGQSPVYVKRVPCLKNMDAMHFILDKKITEDFVERFKPFGKIEMFSDYSGEGFIVKDVITNEGLCMIKRVKDIGVLKKESVVDPNWDLGEEFLCVHLLTTEGKHRLLQTIERQIRKFQVCILCGACVGICPVNAISINPHFRISEDKCCHCGRCLSTKFIKASCVSLNSQQQSRRFSDVNRL